MKTETKVYIWLIDLIHIQRNKLKDCKRTIIIVFEIKVNTSNFSVRLSKKKINKTIKVIEKILKKKSISFTNMQLLVRFLLFWSQVIRLKQVFM